MDCVRQTPVPLSWLGLASGDPNRRLGRRERRRVFLPWRLPVSLPESLLLGLGVAAAPFQPRAPALALGAARCCPCEQTFLSPKIIPCEHIFSQDPDGDRLAGKAVCQRCTCLVPPHPKRHPVLGIQSLLWQEGALGPSELRASQGSQLWAGVSLGLCLGCTGSPCQPAGSRRATGAGPPPGLSSGHPPENPQRDPWQESGLQGRQVLLLHPKLARLCRVGLQSGHTRVWARDGALLEQMHGLGPDRQGPLLPRCAPSLSGIL